MDYISRRLFGKILLLPVAASLGCAGRNMIKVSGPYPTYGNATRLEQTGEFYELELDLSGNGKEKVRLSYDLSYSRDENGQAHPGIKAVKIKRGNEEKVFNFGNEYFVPGVLKGINRKDIIYLKKGYGSKAEAWVVLDREGKLISGKLSDEQVKGLLSCPAYSFEDGIFTKKK